MILVSSEGSLVKPSMQSYGAWTSQLLHLQRTSDFEIIDETLLATLNELTWWLDMNKFGCINQFVERICERIDSVDRSCYNIYACARRNCRLRHYSNHSPSPTVPEPFGAIR